MTLRTFLWGNNTLMCFHMIKPGEKISILEKTNHITKKFYLSRTYSFDLLNTINEKIGFLRFTYNPK